MPRWRFLTKSYVDWLGLPMEVLPFGPIINCYFGDEAPKPETFLRTGVKFEGRWYEREEDGLAFRLVENV